MPNPRVYTKEELRTLHNRIVSNLEQAWEITTGSEDQLNGMMMQISQVVARQVAMSKPQEVTMTKYIPGELPPPQFPSTPQR